MGPPPGGLAPPEFMLRGSKVALALIRIGKSWHQSAQCALQDPACGMCQDAYALRDHIAWPWS